MLKQNATDFIEKLCRLDDKTRLGLAASMTQTMSKHDTIINTETYLYRLMHHYEDLGNPYILERILSKNPNCVVKE